MVFQPLGFLSSPVKILPKLSLDSMMYLGMWLEVGLPGLKRQLHHWSLVPLGELLEFSLRRVCLPPAAALPGLLGLSQVSRAHSDTPPPCCQCPMPPSDASTPWAALTWLLSWSSPS